MAKLDRHKLSQLLKIILPFFQSEMKWRAFGMLLMLTVFSISISFINVRLSYIGRDFMTALSLRDSPEFFRQLYLYLIAFALATPVVVFFRYTEERLALLWRKWMSRRMLQRYFYKRSYYKINLYGNIDNPDQRIEEDVRSFTNTSLSFFLIIFNSMMNLFFFMGILWSISINLSFAVVIYALCGSIATYYLGRPLIGLNFTQLKKEADYRYKLVNIRDNAESIAFLRDEKIEYTRTRQRLKYALDNLLKIINWNRNLLFFTTGYNFLVGILPTIIVAPLYLDSKIEFGVVTQSGFAFAQVLGALSIIVLNFGSLSAYAATISRLGSFWDELDNVQSDEVKYKSFIKYEEGEQVQFKHVTIMTPLRDQSLVKSLSFELDEGGLLITGPSGSGKSSILRALGGLWSAGTGIIVRPELSQTMFLPQRPYMMLGSLRSQLLYGTHHHGVSDQQLIDILKKVGLSDTLRRIANLDAVMDWPNILSSGEQQRLGFARLLLSQPKLAILDEATTALDSGSEEHLYSMLGDVTKFHISVGYRSTLSGFHKKILTLEQYEKWKIENA